MDFISQPVCAEVLVQLCFVTLAGRCSILTCLCQGVRMNDSSSGNCVFHSVSSAKRGFFPFLETRGGGARTCRGVPAALRGIFSAETHHIGCFFVAFLKFPPIVQSGSILFREPDLGGRGTARAPPPAASHWPRCSCAANDIILFRRE